MRSLFVRRVAAYLLDIAILFVVLAPLGFLVQWGLALPRATTGPGVYATLLINFSLPAWSYFALSDASRGGATLGKRLLSIHTVRSDGGPIKIGRAIGRTAVKMVPWELTHIASFLLVPSLGDIGLISGVGLAVAYALGLLFLVVAWRSGGRRSVHDRVATTQVEPTT